MTRYYPLYVRRSDGKLETVHGKKKEKNEPTPDQLNDKPDSNGVSDFYRPIADEEAKHLDWRRKLGGMLMRELASSSPEHQRKSCAPLLLATSANPFGADKACMLAALPENYRLFEHIKSRSHDGDPQSRKASKNHAGGGHDRQDAYLYGHPMGRKKRYRSPADFFPHLLWLATDKEGDPNNCSCKVCCPEEVQDEKESRPAGRKESSAQPPSSAPTPSGIGRDPFVAIPRPPSSQASTPKTQHATITRPASNPPVVQAAPAQAQQAPQAQAQKALTLQSQAQQTHAVASQRTATPQNVPRNPPQNRPSPLPRLSFSDHQIDTKYHTLLFRPGEVLWLSRGEAWGLGVLIRRYRTTSRNNQVERHYIVQPLSHPHDFQTPVHIASETFLRPFLAWSPPPLTFGQLQNGRDTTYDTVDWQAVLSGQYGNGNPEVDGSILAAKAVDNTFTLVSMLNARPGPSMEERHWAGLFLGAEKIWIGEPVRIQMPGVNLPVLVIVDIVERVQQGRSTVTLFGDLYTFVGGIPVANPLPPTDHLPPRMALDLRVRNQISAKAGRQGTWKLLRAMHGIPIEQVKGRWYESSVLLPIVLGDKDYDNAIRASNVDDTSHWLNARNDSNKPADNKAAAPALGVRLNERRDALGRSVPVNTRISDSLDPPSSEELQALIAPAQAPLIQNQSGAHQAATDPALMVDASGFGSIAGVGDVGDFMHLDGDFAITGSGAAGAQGGGQGGAGSGNWGIGP